MKMHKALSEVVNRTFCREESVLKALPQKRWSCAGIRLRSGKSGLFVQTSCDGRYCWKCACRSEAAGTVYIARQLYCARSLRKQTLGR
jgi:hypothetical protein